MKLRFYALWLSLVCIIVFIFQVIIAEFTELFLLNNRAFVEIWRFLTAIFLHASVGHLLYNIFALALFGSILESLVGSRRFLAIFFITGIGANIVSIFFYPSALGASGAIFGVIGALVIIRPMLMVFAFGLPMPIFVAGILWAAGDIIGIFVPSNVGNIAHLAGMFFGLLFGIALRQPRKKVKPERQNSYLDEDSIHTWEDRYMS